MADEKKSFKDLLSEAPLAASEDTVSLVGALARSSDPAKFVLALGQGNNVTLDVAAVKSHQVLGGGVGQLLVQIEVDRSQLPEEAKQAVDPARQVTTGLADLKHPAFETGYVDIKHPLLDKSPWEEPTRTNPQLDDPPFALATAQQAPAESVAAMQAAPASTRTFFTSDINTGFRDVNTGYRDVNTGPYDTGHLPYLD